MGKFSLDIKIEIYKEYKKGRSLQDLSKEYEMNFSNLRYMVKFIDKYGIEKNSVVLINGVFKYICDALLEKNIENNVVVII